MSGRGGRGSGRFAAATGNAQLQEVFEVVRGFPAVIKEALTYVLCGQRRTR